MERHARLLLVALSLSVGCAKTPEAPEAVAAPATAPTPAVEPPSADAELLVLDPAASTVGFVGAKVTRQHEGGFRDVSGNILLEPSNLLRSRVRVRVATASLFTDEADLTEHLKSDDFFDVARYPEATFESSAIAAGGAEGATHTITGALTMHGRTKNVSLPATIAVAAGEVTARAEFRIDRRDFGIVYPGMANDLIRDEVVLRIALRAPRTGTPLPPAAIAPVATP